jgi:hypothetical protein
MKGLKLLAVTSVVTFTCAIATTAFAQANFRGTLALTNPWTSAPYGDAQVSTDYDVESLYAKMAVTKTGYPTSSKENQSSGWSHFLSSGVVYGPTYASSGTTFTGTFSGRDYDSVPTEWSDTKTYKY